MHCAGFCIGEAAAAGDCGGVSLPAGRAALPPVGFPLGNATRPAGQDGDADAFDQAMRGCFPAPAPRCARSFLIKGEQRPLHDKRSTLPSERSHALPGVWESARGLHGVLGIAAGQELGIKHSTRFCTMLARVAF